MKDYTLMLNSEWDIFLNDGGEIATCNNSYGIAQNVCNAFRLFTNDAYYEQEKGIPHFLIELKAHPYLNILKTRLRETALNIDGVADCKIDFINIDIDRVLNGKASLTLDNKEVIDVNF